ncbi:hypothetical protein BV22DRAFT_1112544 [Leucogyrophana mollusca]|uniref:Uncharacterized protein n=1 Tax=Leucogyrophana mollusca TaxID=85980 RepID=A0ACB8BI50_9AGAM|nr:hypothetical protein BV22DRAFT_1112544 [Leucogyrophana mollusca]
MLRVTPLSITLSALAFSLCLNALTMHRLRIERTTAESPLLVDNSHYSYVGDDHPTRLPIDLPYVALEIEDTPRYGISNPEAWSEWRNTDLFSKGNGFVRLGEQGRTFGVSMFHQMHCLQMIRKAVIERNSADGHTHHCLNLMRQAVLCASDTTLDPLDVDDGERLIGTDGIGVVHVCRDWERVYDFVRTNHMSSVWNSTHVQSSL